MITMIRTAVLLFALLNTASGWLFQNSPKAPSKNILASAVGGVAIAASVAVAPVQAMPVTQGEKLFEADCAQCHSAIKKLPGDQTSLQKEALEKYRGGVDETKVKAFVKDEFPHSFMPFASKYSDKDYNDVAKYVVDQAKNDKW